MSRRIITFAVALPLLVVVLAASSLEAAPQRSRKRPARPVTPPPLVWHVETLDGRVIDSHRGEEPINPASVVKVATTWWAIERLGPDHRFATSFYARGPIDRELGVLRGDLVVVGGGDPDFQPENAFLVAAALNDLGVRRVTGDLVVSGRFWTGWEGGSGRTDRDETRRALAMAARLRRDLDPSRWTATTKATWRRHAAKNDLAAATPFRVVVEDGNRFEPEFAAPESDALVVHRSKPLVETMRRFNCYSNNDIERIGDEIGTPDELAAELSALFDPDAPGMRLATTSGLGANRFTPRQIVELMLEFRSSAARAGLRVESLLPVSGCDPGTVTRFYPRLATGDYATALAGKTGTLTATDGGMAIIAGFVNTSQGELVFVVAAPRSGGKLRLARAAEERWILNLIARHGGPRPRECAPPLAEPDDGVTIILAGRETIPASTTAAFDPPVSRTTVAYGADSP